MVSVLHASRNAARVLLVRHRHGLRGFRSFCPACDAGDVVQKPAVTKTKKKYSELPTQRVNPDGSVVAPLEAWYGGLRGTPGVSTQSDPVMYTSAPIYTVEYTTTLIFLDYASLVASPVRDTATDVQPQPAEQVEQEVVKSKRGRKKRTTDPNLLKEHAETETAEDARGTESPPVVGPVKAKRTRKVKEALVSADSEPVVKVKRTRKSKEALVSTDSEPVVKVKRTRKSKVTAAVQEDPLDDLILRQPSTPLANEVLGNLAKFPHCILLTRVGQFYESYFDQAAEVARLLNIKLTTKSWGGQRVPMCGFPLMHLNKHLKTLVQHHKRFVAMCEEFMRSRMLGPKGGFDRRVTRIVTPGTLIDEPFLNPYENNYLLSISPSDSTPVGEDTIETLRSVGLAWIDVSTGEFFAKDLSLDSLRDELARIGPREVVLDSILADDVNHPVRQAVAEEQCFVSYISPEAASETSPSSTDSGDGHVGTDDITSNLSPSEPLISLPLSGPETSAVKLLTTFLNANLLEHMPRLSSPSRETTEGRMQIDTHTIKSLEIRESMREGGTTGSLLSVVKRTVTTSGTRLLARWLCSPSTSVAEINTRQSLVAFFHARPHLRADLVQALNDIDDASRIVQKFLLGRGRASDLSAICTTIEIWSSIKKRIQLEKDMELKERGSVSDDEWASIDALMGRILDLRELVDRIHLALARRNLSHEEPFESGDNGMAGFATSSAPAVVLNPSPAFENHSWTIRPEFSEHLTRLHATLVDLLDSKQRLERRLQAVYDSPSLTLRSSPGQGMHVHIGKNKRDASKIRADPLFIALSESGTTCTFFYQEWSQLGARILETTTDILAAEREAFETLRNEVSSHSTDLRRNARILDELDVTLAFADFAQEMKFSRPILRDDTSYHVVNGRHPTVELGLLTCGRMFTPNTVSFSEDGLLHVITGPNMAGKSTLLRQTALIAILAQTGSFVPADHAELGIVDRVFSRVGAKDDLFRDRSTFMVEMLETADILRRATPNSLVIMDEVGRGTTVEDGLAIAFSTVHHLLSVNRCRALFATHFHELADMLGCSEDHRGREHFKGVHFYCTGVDETEDGYFAYSHRLRPGVNRDSHGLKVAQLAGLPASAVTVAQTALAWFKDKRRSATVVEGAQLKSLGQRLASVGH